MTHGDAFAWCAQFAGYRIFNGKQKDDRVNHADTVARDSDPVVWQLLLDLLGVWLRFVGLVGMNGREAERKQLADD